MLFSSKQKFSFDTENNTEIFRVLFNIYIYIYILSQDPEPLPVQCDTTKQHRFDAKTIIKLQIKDIKTKFIKIAIFKKGNIFIII